LEFVLLRRAINARIGPTGIGASALARLWGASLVAGGAGWAIYRLAAGSPHLVRGITAISVFAVVYGVVTLLLGVPEARALVARVRRR
jgi:putative peptidoglycan lipid II flippase